MKIKIFMFATLLVVNLFAFSPHINVYALTSNSSSNSLCGDSGLIRDPDTGLCVPAESRNINANSLLVRIINFLLSVAAAVAILFIVIGGFRYMTAGGNDEQAQKGQKTLVNAVIGLTLVILSYVIVSVVNNTVSCAASSGLNRVLCRIGF